MLFFNIICCLLLVNINSQSIIKNLNKLTLPVISLTDSDTFIVQPSFNPQPMIIKCPALKKCNIYCRASPAGSSMSRTRQTSSCGNVIIVAGNIPEVKIICEDNACIGTQMQVSGDVVTIECNGPNACTAAKIQCGLQSWNKYLHIPIPKFTRFDRCHITCTDGGCTADVKRLAPGPKTGKKKRFKGTKIKCTGRVSECLVKANSQVQGFTYGPNKNTHIGSFTGGEFICNIRGKGICNVECSDAIGVYYCNKLAYKCKTKKKKCICTDFCLQNPRYCFPFNKLVTKDCPQLTMPTRKPTLFPTLPTTTTTTKATTIIKPIVKKKAAIKTAPTTTTTAKPTTAKPTPKI